MQQYNNNNNNNYNNSNNNRQRFRFINRDDRVFNNKNNRLRFFNRNNFSRVRRRYFNNNNNNFYPPRRYINRNNFNFNNRNNKMLQNMNNQINKLTNKISKMRIEDNNQKQKAKNKIPNVIKTNKEIRTDKLLSAKDAMKYMKPYSFYRSVNPILYVKIYNKATLPFGYNSWLLWFPYYYPTIYSDTLITTQDSIVPADAVSSLISFRTDINNAILNPIVDTITKVTGVFRLVSATLKVTNITPLIDMGGSISAYRDVSNELFPLLYTTQEPPDATSEYLGDLRAYLNGRSLETLPTKLVSDFSQSLEIDEFNVSQGNTIMQSTREYIGIDMTADRNQSVYNFFQPKTINPQGTNIKYLLNIIPPNVNKPQTLLFERWIIFEVEPDLDSTLGTLADKDNKIATQAVINEAKQFFPIHH